MTDIWAVLDGFEKMNSCRITLTLRSTALGEKPDMLVSAAAYGEQATPTVATLLASASVRCLESGYRRLEDAVIFLLYRLDGQLAQGELGEKQSL